MRLLALLLLFGLYACGQQHERKNHSVDPKAKQLNDSALSVALNSEDYDKAIALLDEATKIDNSYYRAFANKLALQLHHDKLDNALITAKSLNRIKPDIPDYFVIVGIIYEKKGDTISSHHYYTEAATRYDRVLDTMSTADEGYDMLLMNKAFNLILDGQSSKGNALLKQFYDNEKDQEYKELVAIFMTKSRQEILEHFFQINLH